MSTATVETTKVELEYDTFGDAGDPALVLIMGFTAQMTAWEERFCQRLTDAGRYVIRFDNRDCGLSAKLDGIEVDVGAVLMAIATGVPMTDVPYTLSDMAADTVGLMDSLGIDTAHLVGASMGGMIAQTIAIEYPERVRTITSIMSMTGELEYGQPTPEAMTALLTPPPHDRAEYIELAVSVGRVFAASRYFDAEAVRQRAAANYDRSFYPEGASRQLAAMQASGSRAEALRSLRVPTLVIHGRADTLIQPSGGERTAELVPGATLLLLDDMGHELPEPLWPAIGDAIIRHTAGS